MGKARRKDPGGPVAGNSDVAPIPLPAAHGENHRAAAEPFYAAAGRKKEGKNPFPGIGFYGEHRRFAHSYNFV